MKRLLIAFIGCLAIMAMTSASGCKNKQKAQESTTEVQEVVKAEEPKPEVKEEELPTIDPNDKSSKVLIKTKFGNMVVKLYDETPQHKANFLKLAKEKYYDDLLFHRCIKNFMAQGGDPNSKGAALTQHLGTGGPGYTVPAEFNPSFIHKKGALCAARQGDQVNPEKRSSGSQFYLVQGSKLNDMQLTQMETYVGQKMPGFKYTDEQKNIYKTIGGTAQLDMDYTVFGEIISGLEVLDLKLAQPTQQGDRPLENITMQMEIIK